MNSDCILSVRGLKTYFYLRGKGQTIKALDGVSIDAARGKITALVGGSGSGKSVLSLSVLGLVDKPGLIREGEIWFDGVNLRTLSERDMLKIRGKKIAMIFQEPSNALNPVLTIKSHLAEAARQSGITMPTRNMLEIFIQTLGNVGLRNPETVLDSYPFELSGGMCQRIMVAMGLLAKPSLLIADEPTSSLDLTTQAVILNELAKLREQGLSVLLITHDLGVVAQLADDVYVIRDGHILENGSVYKVFKAPEHEYTRALLSQD